MKTGDQFRRTFNSSKGETVVTFDTGTNKGAIYWAGGPPAPPPPPPPPPAPTMACGSFTSSRLTDTTFANDDVGESRLPSAQACCEACGKDATCVEWAYHAPGSSQDSQCHLHSAKASRRPQAGTPARVMRR